MASSVVGSVDGPEQPYNWLEQLTSPNGELFSMWAATATVRGKVEKAECIFPPYALIAAIYIHFVESAQPDNEYHTMSHDVVFTAILGLALRRTPVEFSGLRTSAKVAENNDDAASVVCYTGDYPEESWLCCPYHWHHHATENRNTNALCLAIGLFGDWFLLAKLLPCLFCPQSESSSSRSSTTTTYQQEDLVINSCVGACESGELRMVQFLLSLRYKTKDGVGKPLLDPSGRICSMHFHSLLHIAAGNGHSRLVDYLITQVGADLRLADQFGQRPIHMAFENADTEVLSLILKAPGGGCDINSTCVHGFTALHYAALKNRVGAVEMLVNVGGANVDAQNNNGRTPLHCACIHGHTDVIEVLLLKCGASVNLRDMFGETPLAIVEKPVCRAVIKAAGGTL